ncbi:MAG TPA: hypothetical protein VEB59_13910 [Gemmatimonadales bacterium]|nr:hypothetical protein [Gemmatimonadales bacterium]
MPPHPLHDVVLPEPPPITPLLYPGGLPLPACTPDEWAITSVEGDDIVDLPGQWFGAAECGQRLAVWPNKLAEWPRYTDTGDNGGGLDNHFQGIQRLRAPGYAVMSGGDPHQPRSHLFVIRMGSRGAAAMWGSNLLQSSLPPVDDVFVARVDLDATLWHAGGMALLGDVLAVPIESSDRGGSRIEFLSFRDPVRPTDLGSGIPRRGPKAGAVALTRMDDGRFLAAVWSDSELTAPGRHLDFYLSTGPTLLRTGWFGPVCFTTEVAAIPKYQTIALLWNVDEAGRRTDLFLLGFENGARQSPDPRGPNYGNIYHVTLPAELGGPGATLELAPLGDRKIFRCAERFADMDAATGAYRSPTGTFGVYCAYHHIARGDRNKFVARFQEHMSSGPAIGHFPPASLGDSRIELFDLPGLEGEPLLLLSGQARIDDLGTVLVQGTPFANRISSLLCIIPEGFAFVLYRDFDQAGERPLVVVGGAPAVVVRDLAAVGFDDAARSCALVALSAARQLENPIWLEP